MIRAMNIRRFAACLLVLLAYSPTLLLGQEKTPAASATGTALTASTESKPEARKSEPVEVWEYSAYKSRVWLSISPPWG